MKIGFTGTQRGLSPGQATFLRSTLLEHNPTEFHHGDCVGADAEAHEIVRELLPQCKIIIHPPTVPHKQAFCHGDETRVNKPYLQRNRCIVDSVDLLIAAPWTNEEQLRSGTWATIRYARKVKRYIIQLER